MSRAAWLSEAERQIAANAEGWTYEILWMNRLCHVEKHHVVHVDRGCKILG